MSGSTGKNPTWRQVVGIYTELVKPRIMFMVLVTTAIGYLLGGRGLLSVASLFFALLGTALAAGGAGALNNYLERDHDGRMQRTRNRVLPSGVIEPANALAFGVLLVLGGVTLLVWKVNLLTGFLVLLTAFLYVLVYTPLKRVTWLNTSIGAIPGAIPPMSGWTAATGELEAGAWVLFLILFAWQHPHFYSIAWMYRDDYKAAGFQMLPVLDPEGRRVVRHVLGFSAALLTVSVLPTLIGITGKAYLVGALLLGLAMFKVGLRFSKTRSAVDARRLLKASVIYLPILLILILGDGLL